MKIYNKRNSSPLMIWCIGCNKTFGLKQFPPKKEGLYGRGDTCKLCLQNKKDEEKLKQTNETLKSYAKRESTTAEELLELYNNQNGSCKICKRKFKIELISKRGGLFVDHCHKSGAIRGLLCLNCNSGLEMFNDNLLLLHNAIDYLNNSKK